MLSVRLGKRVEYLSFEYLDLVLLTARHVNLLYSYIIFSMKNNGFHFCIGSVNVIKTIARSVDCKALLCHFPSVSEHRSLVTAERFQFM